MRVKVMEKGGVSVAAQLFKPEVSQASCGAPNCYLDRAQGRGGGHRHKQTNEVNSLGGETWD